MSINHTGKEKKVSYVIIHKPKENQDIGWEGYREKVLKRYAPSQAKNLLKDFHEFPTFQYKEKDFPRKLKLRTRFPLITNFFYAFAAAFKHLFSDKAWKEGMSALQVELKGVIYNTYLGYLIQKEKVKRKR